MAKSINRRLAEIVTSTGDVASSALDNIDTLDSADIISISSNTAGATAVFDTLDSLPTSGLSAGQQAYVQSNNRLYVSNGTGWYNLALINQSPNLTIDPTGTIVLATDGSPTTITLTATDSDTPIAGVSFSVESDGNFAGLGNLSQDSSVFTITPLTESDASTTSATLTFKASDGISFGSGTSALSLTFAAQPVQNSRHTIALITATDLTGQDNSPADASPDNLSLSMNGNVKTQSLTPYRYHSISTADVLSTGFSLSASSNFYFGTGDFTIEWWQWWEKDITGYHTFLNINYAGSPNCTIQTDGSNRGYIVYTNGTSNTMTESTEADRHKWYHYALVRNGSGSNNIKMYRNGQVTAQMTSTGVIGNSSVQCDLLWASNATSTTMTPGFFTDIRFVKGTAVYTSTFTPPTEPLTKITGTTFMTGVKPYIDDISYENSRITSFQGTDVRSAKTHPFSPYDEFAFDQTVHGGSLAFDRSSSNIIEPSGLSVGTGDFTISFWGRILDTSTNSTFFTNDISSSSTLRFQFYFRNTGNQMALYGDGSTILTGVYTRPYQWHHHALIRDVSNNKVVYWINGRQAYNAAINELTNFGLGGSNVQIGAYGSGEYLNGSISDYKITNTVDYDYNATEIDVPTQLTSSTGSKLHLGIGADVRVADKQQTYPKFVLGGGINSSSTQAKWGNNSIEINPAANTNERIIIQGESLPASTDIDYGDFTIEAWIYVKYTNLYNTIYHTGSSTVANSTFTQWAVHPNGELNYYRSSTKVVASSNTAISANTWHHVALVGNQGTITQWIDGVAAGSMSSADYTKYPAMGGYDSHIGDRPAGAGSGQATFSGYMQDIRISKGIARYTTGFTPPSAEFEG